MQRTKDFSNRKRNRSLAALCLISLMLTAPAVQANKVVVIPLGSTTNIGASIYWTGEWQDGFQYAIGDGMQYGGSSYLCVKDHVSSSANIPPNETYWSLMAAKGGEGDTGPQGAEGAQGFQGAEGPQGVAGPQGAEGAQGFQGAEGPQGVAGPQGAEGAQGFQGAEGPQGVAGPQGAEGAQGFQGAEGPQGVAGPQGAEGAQGPAGTSSWTDGAGIVTATVNVGIGVGAATPSAKLHVDGEIKMEATTAACDTASAGKIRWSGSDFEGCNGTAWVSLTMVYELSEPTVTSATGQVWMDRNLGASQVATAFDDELAYGDLYQWGRLADGHEKRAYHDPTPQTTSTLSSSDTPGHADFITVTSASNYDWRSPQNPDLWQGEAGTNNPCPAGFRLPTDTEWQAEITEYGATGTNLFNSPLKLVAAGVRYGDVGSLNFAGSSGRYWSSTVDSISTRNLNVASGSAGLGSDIRGHGFSVRCLKD